MGYKYGGRVGTSVSLILIRAVHSSRRPLLNLIKRLPKKPLKEQTTKGMVCVCRLLLVAALLLCLQVQLSASQHWSHGWYPGGKRELDSYSSPQISGEIKLCEAGECSYLRPLKTNVLRNILLGALTKEFQKRK